jgi:hypothetical protein
MDADVPGQVGAGPGERSETRENWRNGYRDRLVAFVISAFLASVYWLTQQEIRFPGARSTYVESAAQLSDNPTMTLPAAPALA